METRHKNAYQTLLLCSVLQLIGTWNPVNFSVLLNAWTRHFETTNRHLMLIFAVQNLTVALVGPAVVPLIDRIGYRLAIFAGMLFATFFPSSFGIL